MIRSPAIEEQVVVFTLADAEYGLAVDSVREIIRPAQTTPVPRAPSSVIGVTNLRGSVLPVIDLRERFALDPAPDSPASRVIVMNMGAQVIGLKVDAASEVLGLCAEDVQDAPEMGLDPRMREAIRAVARLGERLIMLLDPGRLVPKPEPAEEQVAGEVDEDET